MSDSSDDLIISISTDQATLRRSIQNIDRSLQGLASTVKKQFSDAGSAIDKSIATTMQNRINAMVGIGTKAANEWNGALADQGKELERLRAKYSPLFNTINSYKSAVADIRRAHALGAISADEMTSAIARERQAALASTAAIKGRNQALQATVTTSGGRGGANSFQTSNLAAQGFDIASTAAFMPWYTVALQQGPQVSQVFNDIKASGSAIGPAVAGAFMQILNPISLVTIGAIGATAAAVQYFAGLGSDADDAKSVLENHTQLIARIKGAYGEAAEGLNEYAKESSKIVRQDVVDKIEAYRKSILEVARDIREGLKLNPADFKGATFTIDEVRGAVIALDEGIKSGKPDLQGFVERMIDIENQSGTPENIKKILAGLRETASAGVEAERALKPLVDTIDGVGSAAARQAKSFSELTKALRELNEIGKPALTDMERIEEQYRTAMSRASTRDEREDASLARRDAIRRLEDQDPTVINSDGNQTSVPVPAEKPITLGDKPSSDGKKAETAAQRAANAYRDLKKAADDRIAQVQQEIDLLGKFGVEADTARFALDLFQQAEDKGRSLSAEQRAEIEKKIAVYRQFSETLSKAKLQQDLLNERRFNSLSKEDQQVITVQRQYGRPEDLNSDDARMIRENFRIEDARDQMRSFFDDFKNGVLSGGGDIGKAFADAIQRPITGPEITLQLEWSFL